MKTLKSIRRSSFVWKALTAAVMMAALISTQAQTSMIWSINATGAQEVGGGDPDGSAIGTLELNNGTGGNTGFAVINLTLSNLGTVGAPPNYALGGWHIHQQVAGQNGGIVLDFGQINTFLTGNQVSANIPNLSSTVINNVFGNSAGFYLNIHGTGSDFPGGAVRDQLTVLVPEPSVLTMAALGGFVLLRRRKA